MFVRHTGLVLCLLLAFSLPAQSDTGVIRGRVIDYTTKFPIPGASIRVDGTSIGTICDSAGQFQLTGVPINARYVTCSHVGYQSPVSVAVTPTPKPYRAVLIELIPRAIEGRDITVVKSRRRTTDLRSASATTFTADEIQATTGSIGDINRVVTLLPAVAPSREELLNMLIVRGGNPIENGYVLDNMEVPTISHFPIQGTSAGGITLLNNNFLQHSTMYSGAYPVTYGNKLSSFMDIQYREGNTDGFVGRADVSVSGLRVSGEGPLPERRGSWLFSARHSTMDLLKEELNLFAAPAYTDFQGKLTLDLSSRDRLAFTGIYGFDEFDFSHEQARSENRYFFYYGLAEFTIGMGGVNWLHRIPDRGHTQTSLAISRIHFNLEMEGRGADSISTNHSTESDLCLRNQTVITVAREHELTFGGRFRGSFNDYDIFYFADYNSNRERRPPFDLNRPVDLYETGVFASVSLWPARPFSAEFGTRGDYFSHNKRGYVSPNAVLRYQPAPDIHTSLGWGIYTQPLPALLIGQNEAHEQLRNAEVYHLVAGLDWFLPLKFQVKMETYLKRYNHLPLDVLEPGAFILDEILYDFPYFQNHQQLIADGRADAEGVELTVFRERSQFIHGLISAGYARARYRDLYGQWHERVTDSRFTLSTMLNFELGSRTTFGMRWTYADGTPYTPFHIYASRATGEGILDPRRINALHLPVYNMLYVRLEHRIPIGQSLLTAYASVWNVFDREHITGWTWSSSRRYPLYVLGWGTVPVLGLKVEF